MNNMEFTINGEVIQVCFKKEKNVSYYFCYIMTPTEIYYSHSVAVLNNNQTMNIALKFREIQLATHILSEIQTNLLKKEYICH